MRYLLNIAYTLLFALVVVFGTIVLCVWLTGCGHTAYHKVEGTGLYGRIPTPNGGSLIEVAIGDVSITSGLLRGGATYDENTSKGGTFGSVSMGRHTYISTEPAINEGYAAEILTSKDTDPKTKQLIAQYYISRPTKQAQPSKTTSVNSATSSGASPAEATPTRTGVDNVVDKVAETTPKVVVPVANATKSVVKDTATTVRSVSNDWSPTVYLSIITGTAIVLIGLVIGVFFYIKKKKDKNSTTTVNYDKNQLGEPDVPAEPYDFKNQ